MIVQLSWRKVVESVHEPDRTRSALVSPRALGRRLTHILIHTAGCEFGCHSCKSLDTRLKHIRRGKRAMLSKNFGLDIRTK